MKRNSPGHGPVIGVLGGGQLGRMLGLAGIPLGLRFRFFDPNPLSPAQTVGPITSAKYEDEKALRIFASDTDVITYEFENVPTSALGVIVGEGRPVFPPLLSLETAQDRLHEKVLFEKIGIPTPGFRPVESEKDLRDAIEIIGLPAVLKTRRQGYDGKGQAVIRMQDDIKPAWEKVGGVPLTVEQFIPFERELSLICVRSANDEVKFYPLTENIHKEGILRTSRAPAPRVSEALLTKAQSYGNKLLSHLRHVGVLAIEFCEYNGELLAIEMAPRVHNSGHWTIEGAETSQFENHLRAILGLPLGSTQALDECLMINLIGSIPDIESILKIPGAHLHLYDKEPRPGRKVGHITLTAGNASDLGNMMEKIQLLLEPA